MFALSICCSVAKSSPTLCNPMNCSTPGFPAHHHLLELTQTHVHWVSDAIHHLILCHPFSTCTQSFPASGSFPVSRLLASVGQSMGNSVSASVLSMNIQGRFPLGLTGSISLLFKGLSRIFSTPHFKSINSSMLSFLYNPTLISIHDYWKSHSWQSNVSAFYRLSQLLIAFLPKSKCLLISWLQSQSAVIWEPQK